MAVRSAGKKAIGYVHTDGGNRPFAEVQTAITRYAAFYRDTSNNLLVDGFFVDEFGMVDARKNPTTFNSQFTYYTNLRAFALTKVAGAFIVANPGTHTDRAALNVADVVIPCENYGNEPFAQNPGVKSYSWWSPPAWQADAPPNRIAHLAHTVRNLQDIIDLTKLSKSLNAGWIYLTNDLTYASNGNPWDTLTSEHATDPGQKYWSTFRSYVSVTFPYQVAPVITAADARNEGLDLVLDFSYTGKYGNTEKYYPRVYLNTDDSQSTGDFDSSIGAEYMCEKTWCYRWNAATGLWTSEPGLVPTVTASSQAHSWRIDRRVLGGGTFGPLKAQFHFKEGDPNGRETSRWTRAFFLADVPYVVPYKSNHDHQYLYYTLSLEGSFANRHVLIDTAGSDTGYEVGGIKASYAIQNGKLLRHLGGAGWSFEDTGKPVELVVEGNLHRWKIARADIEAVTVDEVLKVIFNAEGASSPAYWSLVHPQTLRANSARNDATNIYYSLTAPGSPTWVQVFIDADRVATNGYVYKGIGADYLIENGNLYRYGGTSNSWTWTLLGSANRVKVGDHNAWTVPRATIGEIQVTSEASDLVFKAGTALPKLTHEFD